MANTNAMHNGQTMANAYGRMAIDKWPCMAIMMALIMAMLAINHGHTHGQYSREFSMAIKWQGPRAIMGQ